MWTSGFDTIDHGALASARWYLNSEAFRRGMEEVRVGIGWSYEEAPKALQQVYELGRLFQAEMNADALLLMNYQVNPVRALAERLGRGQASHNSR